MVRDNMAVTAAAWAGLGRHACVKSLGLKEHYVLVATDAKRVLARVGDCCVLYASSRQSILFCLPRFVYGRKGKTYFWSRREGGVSMVIRRGVCGW